MKGSKTNITIAVDAGLVERARAVARRQGSSLNALLRRHIASIAGAASKEDAAAELLDLFKKCGGNSRGRRIHREDAYEGRT